jgi:hypothetical protein
MDADYIPVGELSIGFSEYSLPPTECLEGKRTELHYASGNEATLTFTRGGTLRWETEDKNGSEEFICPYRAIIPREDFCFIDFIVPCGTGASLSVVLDMTSGIATAVTGILPNPEEVMIPLIDRAKRGLPLSPVRVIFEHAAIDGPFLDSTPRHGPTRDLVGKRIEWVYSSKDAYEHIYLNENTYSWHCIAGNEKGLADTDRCFFYKIADRLYLFVWIEKIVPTLGVLLEDLAIMRSYGKIFGYQSHDMDGRITNFPVGSYGTLLNRTEYDLSRLRVHR